MAKGSGKDARHKAHSSGSKLKSLRRELTDLEADMERARTKRDKAQARVEALEAIAEQLASAIASAAAEEQARQSVADAAATDGSPSPPSTAPAAEDTLTPHAPRHRRVRAGDEPDEGAESIDLD